MQPAKKRATYQDLLALSDEQRREIVDGELLAAPSPLPRHSRAQRALGGFLGGGFDDDGGHGGPGGWWILIEVDIEFDPHHVLRPDISGWLRERLPDPWDQRPLSVVPDFVCEVTSPSNAALDRVIKRRLYAQFGVPYYWIVDPQARTLEALRLAGDSWLELGSYGDGDVARIQPFEALELEVSRLFPPLPDARQGS